MLNIFIAFCRCVCPSLKKSVCRCGCACTSAFVSVCVCSARLCSAAAVTWDSGSLCREQKADVMQQESPSQQSQVPTAAREIILKRCMCVRVCMRVCMHVYRVSVSASVCVPFVYMLQPIHTECFFHIGGSVQGLSPSHAERGIAFSCFISCWEKGKTVELQRVPAEIQRGFQY